MAFFRRSLIQLFTTNITSPASAVLRTDEAKIVQTKLLTVGSSIIAACAPPLRCMRHNMLRDYACYSSSDRCCIYPWGSRARGSASFDVADRTAEAVHIGGRGRRRCHHDSGDGISRTAHAKAGTA